MRIHYLQHVPYEGLGFIQDWIDENRCLLTKTAMYKTDVRFPKTEEFDLLIVLGGPMNIDQTDEYPWLLKEKEFISGAIQSGKKVLGICMGSQLTASALGGRVSRNEFEEVGWHEVKMRDSRIPGLPASFQAMQWHGDSFSIPEGAVWLAESEACSNQAFLFGDKVIGLQFHLEFTEEIVSKVAESETPAKGRYVQSWDEIAEGRHHFQQSKSLIKCFLNYMMDN
ncbi:type 1 glutamine amidotransferase [Bacillus sp. FJAT-42376]|uniref:type 1 glutamine amidotransferase n=1 Tax=Bacillus sp. FJAT-42376 TaxID=2014076 RepID=UPI000F4E7F3C|nr:type 1 glutamine amidotransferase [Bacillus sp. FJAT-42376]AZB44396.1 type 1 glutamine amidotransferase [Bacillus sp. FJAT-42376]